MQNGEVNISGNIVMILYECSQRLLAMRCTTVGQDITQQRLLLYTGLIVNSLKGLVETWSLPTQSTTSGDLKSKIVLSEQESLERLWADQGGSSKGGTKWSGKG